MLSTELSSNNQNSFLMMSTNLIWNWYERQFIYHNFNWKYFIESTNSMSYLTFSIDYLSIDILFRIQQSIIWISNRIMRFSNHRKTTSFTFTTNFFSLCSIIFENNFLSITKMTKFENQFMTCWSNFKIVSTRNVLLTRRHHQLSCHFQRSRYFQRNRHCRLNNQKEIKRRCWIFSSNRLRRFLTLQKSKRKCLMTLTFD